MSPAPNAAEGGNLLGHPPNHWVHHPKDTRATIDLTRPAAPYLPPAAATSVRLHTTSDSIALSPALTALVVIDMQNFFLSTALGRDASGPGHAAMQTLLRSTIPACRRAGIRVVWLNWGVTEEDIASMPPALLRGFGSLHAMTVAGKPGADAAATHDTSHLYCGFGAPLGPVTLADGSTVDAGRLLVRGEWNARLPDELDRVYQQGKATDRPDAWVHKDRLTGLWGAESACTEFLKKEGIRTLLFAGVNTDQCVAGSLQDAFTKGWDCVLVRDACGTSSPDACREMVEYNTTCGWGFVIDSAELERGVDEMEKAQKDA